MERMSYRSRPQTALFACAETPFSSFASVRVCVIFRDCTAGGIRVACRQGCERLLRDKAYQTVSYAQHVHLEKTVWQ